MANSEVKVYTDGSCIKTGEINIGAWVALIFFQGNKIVLKGIEKNTTHNRMELVAVISAIEYLDKQNYDGPVSLYTDSQYVEQIRNRSEKLKRKNFLTNKGTAIQNVDLVKTLVSVIESHSLGFIKVKAHQKEKDPENYNQEADKLVRELARDYVKKALNSNNLPKN